MTSVVDFPKPDRPIARNACDPRATDPFALASSAPWAAASRIGLSAFQQFAVEASWPWTSFFGNSFSASLDLALYDVQRLTEDELEIAQAFANGPPEATVVVHPHETRPPTYYSTPEALRHGADRFVGVLATPEASASPRAAIAFARQVADAVDAPTIAIAPEAFDSNALLSMIAPGDAEPRAGDDGLAALLTGGLAGVRLVVSHGLGAGRLARALHTPRASMRPPSWPTRLLSLGGAPAATAQIRATNVVGGLDAYGGWISAPDAKISLSPPLAGRHLTPHWPFGLDLAAIVAGAAREDRAERRSP